MFSTDNLGPFILLLHQISEDHSMKHFLSKTDKTSKSVKKHTSEITTEDLPEVFYLVVIYYLKQI